VAFDERTRKDTTRKYCTGKKTLVSGRIRERKSQAYGREKPSGAIFLLTIFSLVTGPIAAKAKDGNNAKPRKKERLAEIINISASKHTKERFEVNRLNSSRNLLPFEALTRII
jgi:hypothetical protein